MNKTPEQDLTPSELLSDYPHWLHVSSLIREGTNTYLKQWLKQWESFDSATSPMSDNERRFIRYGHYLGWCDARQNLEFQYGRF